MNQILVTSYSNPDLDGTACSYAYAEYLSKTGHKAIAGIFGTPDKEASYELRKLGLEIESASNYVDNVSDIALVDASNLEWLEESIDSSKISKVIDHREHNISDQVNAESQIELVGAAATLIAEKFNKNGVEISKESAELLYTAIADNTTNFQANVTTPRDRDMANWLAKNANLDEEIKNEIFRIKSDVGVSVSELIESDYYNIRIAEKKVGIAQLEMLNTEKYIRENIDGVKENLTRIREEENLDYIFITSVDIEQGKNIFVVPDSTRKLIENALGISFNDSTAVDNRVLLRKEIIPKIESEIKKSN